MSQPQPDPTPAPADGASALLAAANKTGGGRRTRHVPTAKNAATKPAPEPVAPVAWEPSQAPEPAPVTEETGQTPATAQQPPQPPPPAEPVKVPEPEAPAPASPAPESPSSKAEVAFPSKPLSFESVFAPKTHSMDPEMFAVFRLRQEKLLKSMANIVRMFNERRTEFENSVRAAVAAGFPREELVKLAIANDCLPILEAALGDSA